MRSDYATKADLKAGLETVRSDLDAVRIKVEALETNVRAIGVVVERIESKIGVFAEAFGGVASKSEVAAVEERLTGRISVLEEVVRQRR